MFHVFMLHSSPLSPRDRVFILLSRGLFFTFRGVEIQSPAEPAGAVRMIVLTRLNGQNFVVNAEKIRTVEATPDTVVCCETGERLMVRETLEEVIRRAIEYGRMLRKPITD
jgi:flagellar protein FlbD